MELVMEFEQLKRVQTLDEDGNLLVNCFINLYHFSFFIFMPVFSHLRVPLPLSRPIYHLQYFVVAYFLVTLGFHVADIIKLLTYNQNSTSGVEFLANQTLTTFNITWNSSSLSDLHNRRWRINNILSTNETH